MPTPASLNTVQSLYVTYYGRPADPAGLDFWATVLDEQNGDLSAILQDFGTSAEYTSSFGNLSSPELINNLYQQMFGRDAEPGGLSFWANILDSGALSLMDIANSIRTGAGAQDRQVLEARVELANAFTEQLDQEDELQAYGTARGIAIGRDYLNQVNSGNAANPPLDQVVDVVATLLPATEVPTPPGGGGAPLPPATPTLTLQILAGELSFTGTATGDISVAVDGENLVFSRGAASATLPATEFDSLSSIALQNQTLNLSAERADGLDVTGSGTLNVSGVTQATDLSGVDSALSLSVSTAGDIDLTVENALQNVDSISISEGDTLTLNAQQAVDLEVSGDGTYELRDTQANFQVASLNEEIVSGASRMIFVTDEQPISIAELMQQLELLPEGVDTQLTATFFSENIEALVSWDEDNQTWVANSPISEVSAVDVLDTASIAQLTAIDTANGDSALSYSSITDLAANLVVDGVASSYILADTNVTVSDAASIAALTALDAIIEGGSLSANAIVDDIANLVSEVDSVLTANSYIQDGTDVTVNDAASIDELTLVDDANGDGELNYSALQDSASNLLDSSYTVTGIDLTVTGTATIAQLGALDVANGEGEASGELSYELITDDIANLVTLVDDVQTANTYITSGTNVSVNDAASVAQIAAIDAANGDGELSYSLSDSLANLLAANQNLVTAANSVSIDGYPNLGTLSVAQLEDVLSWQDASGEALYDIGDLTYNLLDSASNLLTAPEGYVSGAVDVTASGQTSLSQASALYLLDDEAIYSITASPYDLANTANSNYNNAINHAVDLTASSTATVAQAEIIDARTNRGDTNYNLGDYYSNLVTATEAINAAHNIQVYDYQLTTTQAQAMVDLSNDGVTVLNSVTGTAVHINTFVGANPWSSEELTYNFRVSDTAANIVSAAGSATTFISGNAAEGEEGDHRVSLITVTDTLTVANAKTFWEVASPILEDTLSNRTTYSVSDTLANYQADAGAENTYTDWLNDADSKTVTGTAADIYAGQLQGNAIFNHMNGSNDHIEASGSDGNQSIQGAGGSDTLNGGNNTDWLYGNAGNDTINGDGGNDYLYGGDGNDTLHGGAGDDYLDGGNGNDWLYGDTGFDRLLGGDGRDIIYAGSSAADTATGNANYWQNNQITGGNGGDNMFGSDQRDVYYYSATNRSELIAETGTTVAARDYIHNFTLGDSIVFQNADQVQFLGTGSSNAAAVEAGEFAISVRYEKNVNAAQWANSTSEDSTLISIDIANADGTFDNIADATIVLVGANIDINMDGNTIMFGG